MIVLAHRIRPILSSILLLGAVVLSGCDARREKARAGATPKQQRADLRAQLKPLGSVPMVKAREIIFSGDAAFVAQNLDGMTLLDARDPRQLKIRRTFDPSLIQPLAFKMADDSVMVIADRFRGLVIWDVSNPDEPTSLTQISIPGIATHLDLFSTNERRYAALACGGEGVTVADITDLRAPSIVGRFAIDIDYSRRIKVQNEIAFLADNYEGGLKLIDLSRPDDPQLLLKVGMPGFHDSVAVESGLLFAACRNYGTRVFELRPQPRTADDRASTPVLTLLCTVYRSRDRVRDVMRLRGNDGEAGDFFVAANDEGGVDLYDIANPALPVLADEWRYPVEGGTAMSCVERKRLLYVPSWDAGLFIFEIAREQGG